MKCDVIIPVYNAADWVKLCVESILKHNMDSSLRKILLIDDASDAFTKTVLNELKSKSDKIEILTSSTNQGFIKTVNIGMTHSEADYVLLLNSDCLITPNTITKLIKHCEKDKSIGLISPLSNNSPVVTLDMLQGHSFLDMNSILEKYFPGISFDACTIVGNCLLITRECLKKTGLLNEIYGKGYGEETEYQFTAMQHGFKAKIAIDTYVFHKSEASFGANKEMQIMKDYNWHLFMQRWGKEHALLWEDYIKNEPIRFVQDRLDRFYDSNQGEYDVLFYLPGIKQRYGGMHVVVDIVNELILSGIKANIITPKGQFHVFEDKLLFQPILINSEFDFINGQIEAKYIVATCWDTAYPAYIYSTLKNIPLIYLVQGYEVYFDNARIYGKVEETYQFADEIISVSGWLSKNLEQKFHKSVYTIPNGYNEFIFYPTAEKRSSPSTFTFILRGYETKGDWILQDVLKLVCNEYGSQVKINLIHFDNIEPCTSQEKINLIKAPLSKKRISQILRETDILVDASLHEGFGLFPLEAMASGAVVIASDSGGVNAFLKDGQNGFIVKEVNNSDKYFEKIKMVMEDKNLFTQLRTNALSTVQDFQSTQSLQKYVEYFKSLKDKSRKIPSEKKHKHLMKYLLSIPGQPCPPKSLTTPF